MELENDLKFSVIFYTIFTIHLTKTFLKPNLNLVQEEHCCKGLMSSCGYKKHRQSPLGTK